MTKATLTALAWHQFWILWLFVSISVLLLAYFLAGWQAVVFSAIGLLLIQNIRAYRKLAMILRQLESRHLPHHPSGLGVWAALETLIYKKNTEQRIRVSRLVSMLRGYRLAANTMPEGALLVNRHNGYIMWSNKMAKKMLGLSASDSDSNLFRLFQAPIKNWFLAHNHDQPMLNVASPRNSAAFMDFFLLPYTEENSLLILRDSTKMRRLEQMRSDFVANVSHELRTPLTVIHGYLELIEQQENAELKQIIQELQKQSTRMNHLVEDLLNLSRLESENDLPDEFINCPSLLNALHQEAIALSQNRHRIQIISNYSGQLLGSSKDIHSAFSNLVSNAVRYTAQGGNIEIGLGLNAQQCLEFYVQDTGFGIPQDQISRLTERFYRVSSSRSRELGGTGLGLSICKHVLNLHQAELLIESQPGKGSRFTCRFPVRRTDTHEHFAMLNT